VDDLGWGGGRGWPSTGRPETFFLWPETIFLAFQESVLKFDPRLPPPVHGRPDRNIFCVSDVFRLDTVRTSEMGRGGGAVCQTDDVGQRDRGGGSKKSVFGRTSLMDDPIIMQLVFCKHFIRLSTFKARSF